MNLSILKFHKGAVAYLVSSSCSPLLLWRDQQPERWVLSFNFSFFMYGSSNSSHHLVTFFCLIKRDNQRKIKSPLKLPSGDGGISIKLLWYCGEGQRSGGAFFKGMTSETLIDSAFEVTFGTPQTKWYIICNEKCRFCGE